jgi:hypothetical protein
MKHFIPKKKHGPEAKIQDDIIKMLRMYGWFVKATHGNMYQSGFPDLFACHYKYGHRWIEVKDPNRGGDIFTAAQHEIFPKLAANGSGVWVLVAATEKEYDKLFNRQNWYMYLEAFR